MLPRSLEWLLVVIIVIGLTAILYPAVQQARGRGGPYGEMIPSKPPDEANRIRHPSGLSIVAPTNWDSNHLGAESSYLYLAPRGGLGRVKSLISIELCPSPPMLDGFERTEFQRHEAYEQMRVERKDTFDDPAWSRYDLYVNDNGHWWHVTFGIAREMTELPWEIRQHIETIQFP